MSSVLVNASSVKRFLASSLTVQQHNSLSESHYGHGRGCCVPPERGGGGGAHSFSTVRGAPQNGDDQTCMRQVEPQEILCNAMQVSDLESLFFFFLRGSGSSGSAVTSISGSTG